MPGEDYKVWLKDEVDIFPTVMDYSTFSIVSLNLTKDVANEYFDARSPHYTAASCWGTPWNIAKNQPIFQHYLARNMDIETVVRFHQNDLENNPDMVDQTEKNQNCTD